LSGTGIVSLTTPEREMASRKLAILTLMTIALTTSALAQGAGGGGGGAGSGAASGTSGAATGGAGTGGTDENSNSAAQTQTNTDKIVAGEQSAAIKGTKTVATPGDSGAVSAPGVGVGHAANGQPIGSPGSGLGSPENSAGSTK
jgi:hypothetical protein